MNRWLLIDNSNSFSKFRLANPSSLENWQKIVPTKSLSNENSLFFLKEIDFDQVVLCSVVPESRKIFQNSFKNIPFAELNLQNLPSVINSNNIEGIGNDRLANILSTWLLYECPALIIDMGTAITFDFLGEKGEILGGMIFPGMEMAKKSLHSYTSLLPLLDERKYPEIGLHTEDAIYAGIFQGYQGVIENILQKAKKWLPSNHLIIATGGGIPFLKENFSGRVDIFNSDLTLEGIRLFQSLNSL